MSEKRRDNRNRILREGEYQRTDGRYRYRYIDEDGKEKNVYSWRLDKNDPTPKGKKREPSLREKEKQIQADLFDHIVTRGGNYTVVELVEKYTSLKTGVGHNTKAGYKTVINILNKEAFGKQRIDKVRLSDAKAWLIKLQQVDGRGYSSIHSIRGVLRPAFQMAVDDDLIRKNPFGFELASVIVNDSVTREAITRKQERELLKFIKEDKHFCQYYDAIYILFNTGLRISEFCGLTFSDLEFDQKRIKVDHQLQRTSQMKYVIGAPKTESGIRQIPMSEKVYEALGDYFRIQEGQGKDIVHNFELTDFYSTCQLPPLQIHHALKLLELSGYIEYCEAIDESSFQTASQITYTHPRVQKNALIIPSSAYEKRRKRMKKRISKVVEYMNGVHICRSRLLLSYFGEKNTEDCGCCDVCLSKNDSGLNNRDFNAIRDLLLRLLSTRQLLPVTTLLPLLPFPEEKIVTTIRFLAEHDKRFYLKEGKVGIFTDIGNT